jgi:thymidylate synthase (FAD)
VTETVELLPGVRVALADHMGDDNSIARAARVSVVGENDPREKDNEKLINYLMREHHGSPFEHTDVTFSIEAPIFVFREFHRHRAGWSYNEMSGRYTTLPSRFYVPDSGRPLVNSGSPSAPQLVAGTYAQVALVQGEITRQSINAWDSYQKMLKAGIANEVARIVLPLGIMSQMYATANLRAIFHFLSLRTLNKPNASFKSRPQYEIALVADQIELIVADLYPIAYKAFQENGRVAP